MARYRGELDEERERELYGREGRLRRESLGAYDEPYLGRRSVENERRPALRRRGQPYADYLAVTSTIPFAAIVGGRQRLVWRELPLGTLAAGVGAAVVLRLVHAGLFADGGLWIVLAAVGGGGIASLQSWLRARRQQARGSLQRVRG